MITIRVKTKQEYDVVIGGGVIDNLAELFEKAVPSRSVILVSDDTVYALYGKRVALTLKAAGIRVHTFKFPHGEQSKSPRMLLRIWDAMARACMTRGDAAVALGGGVTGDLTGFAAATYERGIRYVSIPTTLLAMVDSSVGGKTAVNLKYGKNLVGAFHQPSLVVCDPDLLSTLSEHNICDGMAEIIKYGMINRPSLLDSLENGDSIEDIIAICVNDKRVIVERDEHDNDVRMLLNFGHTVGHAIEKLSDYKVSHGYAVAAGMAIITRASIRYGMCDRERYERLKGLLTHYKLPIDTPYGAGEITAAALTDKKRADGKISLVLPVSDLCRIKVIDDSELYSFIEAGLPSDGM